MVSADALEIARLRNWKQGALIRLGALDRMHELLPESWKAELGESKDQALLHYLTCQTGYNG